MDSMEVNKAFGAVLAAGIAFLGSGLLADALVRPRRLEHTVLKIEGTEEQQPAGATMAQQQPEGPPVAVLLASADPAAGEAATKKLCVSCHSFNQGGKAGVGPNLYGVVGAPHGHMEGFAYSDALKSKQGPWTFDELNEWLKNPRGYAPGTKMSFAGIANDKQRADVIDYLRTLSPNPEPLPAPPAGGGATPAKADATDNAPTSGVTRPQQGRVVGGGEAAPTGTPQTSGQQMSQPSPSQSSAQTEQNQSQQNPDAGGSAVRGQQMSQPSPSQSSPQTEQNQAQQSPDAAPAPSGR